jgi:hypothetical protein
MKWDHTTDPPAAWRVEDGDWAKIDSKSIVRCSVCAKWFVQTDHLQSDSLCSTGCRLRNAEETAGKITSRRVS